MVSCGRVDKTVLSCFGLLRASVKTGSMRWHFTKSDDLSFIPMTQHGGKQTSSSIWPLISTHVLLHTCSHADR